MLQDENLAMLLAADVNKFFDMLVITYQQELYTYIWNLLHNQQDAEEIVQDTFLCAYRALIKRTPEEIQMFRLRPWLFTIAVNLSRNHMKRERKTLIHTLSSQETEAREYVKSNIYGQGSSLEGDVEAKETLEAIAHRFAPRHFTPNCHLTLYYWPSLS